MSRGIFDSEAYENVQRKVKEFLNAQEDFLSPSTVGSTRAVGDAIQELLCDSFDKVLGDYCQEYSASFARRAMADLAFTDCANNYCIVDVKTHRLETKFNMPNLTSVKRLAKFYEEDANFFALLMISYEVIGSRVSVRDVIFAPIEFFAWDCLFFCLFFQVLM